jgi:hypothetical protein
MSDDRIERSIAGVLAVADSNFPSDTDIQISTTGRNSASIRISSYELSGIMALAKEAKELRKAAITN